jgi:hypothetical protein
MKNKFFVYAMLVTLLTSGVSWTRLLTSSGNSGNSSGSGWNSRSGYGGGSWGSGSGGGGGHK